MEDLNERKLLLSEHEHDSSVKFEKLSRRELPGAGGGSAKLSIKHVLQR